MTRAQLSVLLMLGLAGCAEVSPQLPVTPPPPPPAEFATLDGAAAFRTPAGGVGSCAGQSVLLMPDTPESRARIIALYGPGPHVAAPVTVVKTRQARLGPPPTSLIAFPTQCDPTGRFGFQDLRAGEYFLIARVRVRPAPSGQEDLVILQRLTLRTGEARQVELSP